MKRLLALVAVIGLIAPMFGPATQPALASHTPDPSAVTIAGSLQSELGCSGDWQPDCAATHLAYDGSDDVWQATFALPAGSFDYKADLNDSWTENYGLNATRDGLNIPLTLPAAASVKFYYDHKSHWVTDSRGSTIAVAPGSFQSELGCAGDWDPSCLRSWLQDPDGDGIYTLETTALPAGSYETKVAINESWDENYGQGGVPGGANIPFTVPVNKAKVIFRYDASTHVLTVLAGHAHDGNVETAGLRHDSRDLLYRTPGGAVPAATPVTVRFRTFHDDVTAVGMRVYDLNAAAQHSYPMTLAARDVSCYEPALVTESCDYWAYTLASPSPDNFWYRFTVNDGAATAYYADDTGALDGGVGASSATPIDQSYALMFYDPAFAAPDWARNAVIYQIFPDRFRNGNPGNDPVPGASSKKSLSTDPRYAYPGGDPTGASRPEWDQIIQLRWGDLPEGYCRNYAASAVCPARFPEPAGSRETPRGRDYFGGDLQGVTKQLDYLTSLGVTAIYFNPIFDGASNHGYDTQDYYRIDPYFGDLDHFQTLVREASRRGMRVILDGVFNHVSSDSPFFDRYHHYPAVGACESAASPYRAWFHFRAPQGSEPSPCVPSTPGGTDTYYDGWFGFDSIPVLTKSIADVQRYFVNGPNSVTRYWLHEGASGWRLDVMGDASFPDGYWESFRQVVKATDPNALIIGELWQKDSTLLRFLRGDRADTTMNYRLRDAVLGLLAMRSFDAKGFGDSGRILAPSEFAARIASIREDYPDAAYYALMDLLDSHDTERLLWTLTPGTEDRASREDPANLAIGKQRMRIASLIQFTMPGAPTIYYGDEVGLTGDDDPDDRRTYPWADLGGSPDTSLLQHYRTLAALRRDIPALTAGDLQVLLADDAADTLAYGRKTTHQAAIVAVNRSAQTRTLDIKYTRFLPDGTPLQWRYGGTGSLVATGGVLHITLAPLSAALLATDLIDLEPPAAPTGLHVTATGDGSVSLAWSASSGAAAYNVYRSPVTGGGWVRANASPVTATSFVDSGLRNASTYYYVVRALDALGNESGPSNEVSAVPHYTIGWANLQWPPTLTHTISAVQRTDNVYGQVWIDGVTSMPGATPTLRAQLGFGPDGSDPASAAGWDWVNAAFNVDAGNNDEFVASLLPEAVGTYDYAYRYTTTDGLEWVYADLDGIQNGYSPAQAGALTVNASGDTTAPATPTGLHVTSASATQIVLVWNAVSGDPTLYGYEVRRGTSAGGPYATIARVSAAGHTDTNVNEGATYYYVVRSVDTSFNRSPDSAEVSATAALRTVSVTFMVTVPTTTDGTGRTVHIAGTLSRLDGGLPDWDPGATVLIRVDATHWRITLSGKETTQLEYKYTLGDWDHVEKGASCDELGNRQLTLVYGATGTQAVNDTVLNWRAVAPCGS